MRVVLGGCASSARPTWTPRSSPSCSPPAASRSRRSLWPWAGLDGVVAARVLDVRDHPNSDKLCVARDRRRRGERDVVVGRAQHGAGRPRAVGGPGARVPVLAEPLTERAIRGDRSEGMLCSPRELRISAEHGGILLLRSDRVEPGADVKELFGLDDAVLDIEMEPNRPDLLSVIGVAREVAVATGVPLREPDVVARRSRGARRRARRSSCWTSSGAPATSRGCCGRPVGAVAAAIAGAADGVRHAADVERRRCDELRDARARPAAARLRPRRARRSPASWCAAAKDGRATRTLDDVERLLDVGGPADRRPAKAVAIAGVMGGAGRGVERHGVICSWRARTSRRQGCCGPARRLGLTHRGVRTVRARDRSRGRVRPRRPGAAGLIAAWAGAGCSKGSLEEGGTRRGAGWRCEPAGPTALLGTTVATGARRARRSRGSGSARRVDDGAATVEVPGYRVDVHLEEDLIEEVARVIGLRHRRVTMPTIRQAGGVPAAVRVPGPAAGSPGREPACTRSGCSRSRRRPTSPWPATRTRCGIANPLSVEEGLLPHSARAGLARTPRRTTWREGCATVAMFEVGTVFRVAADAGRPGRERSKAAFVLAGPADPMARERSRIGRLRREGDRSRRSSPDSASRRGRDRGSGGSADAPGRSATVWSRDDRAGVVGELHPRVARTFDLDGSRRRRGARRRGAARCTPERTFDSRRRPPVPTGAARPRLRRGRGGRRGRRAAAIVAAGGELLDGVELFDVFTGGSIPEGRKSLGVRARFPRAGPHAHRRGGGPGGRGDRGATFAALSGPTLRAG